MSNSAPLQPPHPEPSPYSDLPQSADYGEIPAPQRPPPTEEQKAFRKKAAKRVARIQAQLEGLLRDAMARNRVVVPQEDIHHVLATVVESVTTVRDRAKSQPELDFG